MKAFKINNIEKVKQEVNLPAGTYTYSCRVIPVGTSYTFKLDNLSFTFEGLTAGVLNKRMKHTFELTETASFFYLSNTIGDCVYEPQIEEGVFATTPGAHALDFERLISETGIDIDSEVLSLYAKKPDVSAEIKIQTDRIDSTVGNISNDIDGIKRDVTTISQTTTSITATVTNHTLQIATFQTTVDQIYLSIKDVGSDEFAHILTRLGEIELKVGATGQSGSIQVALDSIALAVYDENEGMSAINQKVGSITTTVTNHTTQISTFQQTVDQIYLAIEDVGSGEFASITTRLDKIELKVGAEGKEGSIQVAVNEISSTVYDENTGMSALNQKVGSITATVTNHTSQISTFQQTVDQIYLAIEDVGSGEFASIIQRLDGIELKVGATGQEGSIQVAVDSVTTRVNDIDVGLTEVVVKVGSITTTVADHTGKIALINTTVDNVELSVADIETGMAAIDVKVNSISSTVSTHTGQISTFQQTVDQIYLAIEDVGSGEFASIIARLDKIELKVGAEGKEGSIQVAVDSISSTVSNHTGEIASIDVRVNSVTTTVADHVGRIASIDVRVDSVTTTVADNTGKIATIDVKVDSISSTVYDENKGMSAINQKVGSIALTVADNEDKVAELRVDVDSISSTVYDENTGMSAIVQTVNSISSTVYDKHGALLSKISQNGTDILIKGSQIDLEGVVTANNNFKILTDGSIEAKNGKFTGEINAKNGGSIGAFDINNGMLTAYYSYFTYIGSTLVNVTSTIELSSGGVRIEASYGGTTDHPQVVAWDSQLTPGGVKVGSMEVKRDGIYRNGILIL